MGLRECKCRKWLLEWNERAGVIQRWVDDALHDEAMQEQAGKPNMHPLSKAKCVIARRGASDTACACVAACAP